MHRDAAPALRGTRLGALLRLLNVPMRIVLGSPLHGLLSRWFLLVRWVGPRTGQPHVTPISYVSEGGNLYATTGDSWWHNVVRSSEVDVAVRGNVVRAQVVAIEPPERTALQLAWLFRRHPFFRRLAGIPESSAGQPDVDAVRRSIKAGRTLLRIDLESAGPA